MSAALRTAWFVIATGFGLGYVLPRWQGTVAALAAALFLGLFLSLPILWQIVLIIGGFLIGVWAATKAENSFGIHDDHRIVIDEIVSVFITFAVFPPHQSFGFFLLGFLANRILDIAKPFFIGRLQRLPRGWGIMADDALGGIYANIFLRLIFWLGT